MLSSENDIAIGHVPAGTLVHIRRDEKDEELPIEQIKPGDYINSPSAYVWQVTEVRVTHRLRLGFVVDLPGGRQATFAAGSTLAGIAGPLSPWLADGAPELFLPRHTTINDDSRRRYEVRTLRKESLPSPVARLFSGGRMDAERLKYYHLTDCYKRIRELVSEYGVQCFSGAIVERRSYGDESFDLQIRDRRGDLIPAETRQTVFPLFTADPEEPKPIALAARHLLASSLSFVPVLDCRTFTSDGPWYSLVFGAVSAWESSHNPFAVSMGGIMFFAPDELISERMYRATAAEGLETVIRTPEPKRLPVYDLKDLWEEAPVGQASANADALAAQVVECFRQAKATGVERASFFRMIDESLLRSITAEGEPTTEPAASSRSD